MNSKGSVKIDLDKLVKQIEAQQDGGSCPEGCCDGTEILCVSIPCPVTIVLLGLELQLELPCIRLTSESTLTSDQVSQLLNVLTSLIQGIVGSLS